MDKTEYLRLADTVVEAADAIADAPQLPDSGFDNRQDVLRAERAVEAVRALELFPMSPPAGVDFETRNEMMRATRATATKSSLSASTPSPGPKPGGYANRNQMMVAQRAAEKAQIVQGLLGKK